MIFVDCPELKRLFELNELDKNIDVSSVWTILAS
jgi:hypothetical protein